ncbi:major facilitator superfamily domain-containing protein 10-like [Mercenaria mercenaria]|uniref:major facilitator superfamily domain-containing protein 10-like n=1 Tax=Mercenaria mercenaria TaxID=6596 RepID=UPI00234E48E3|nr:major facilitator superfamily domain-containing protein 10-like [Mercenaria mercenaria]
MVVTRSQKNGDVSSSEQERETTESKDKTGDTTLSSSEKKMLRTVFISLVIDLLAFTVILPLLPSLLDYYGTKEDGLYRSLKDSVSSFRELVGAPDTPRWNSVLFGGLIGSLFSLLQFIASPLIGATSDVYGRKPVLVLSMVGVAFSYALWAISRNFGLFVIARIVGGISKGNISLSTTVVADVLPPQRRGKGMALIGVAFSIGFVFGPLIGAIFSRWAREQQGEFYVMPALFALILSVIDVIYVAMVFKETLPHSKRAKSISSGWQNTSYLINPFSLFRFSSVTGISQKDMSDIRKIGVVYFLYLFFYSGLEFTLTFLTHNRLNYDSMQQGKMFFFIGFIMAAVQGGYTRRASAGKEMKMAAQGILILVPSFVIMAFAYSAFWIYLSLALFSFASATVVPCLTTLISLYGGNDQKGTIMGIFRSLGALARALGPVFASTMYWSCGAAVCYITGGVLLLLPYFLLKRSSTNHVKSQ